MQGNERNQSRIDAPFTDHAWMEMKKMLDLEMPVSPSPAAHKEPKKYILLLLFLLFGFIAGVVTMLYFDEDSTPIEPVEQKQVMEVAAIDILPEYTDHKASSAMGGGGITSQTGIGFSKSKSETNKSIVTNFKLDQNLSKHQNLVSNSSLAIAPFKDLKSKSNQINELKENSMVTTNESGIDQNLRDHVPGFLNSVDIHPDFETSYPVLELIEFNQKEKLRFGFRLGTYSRSLNDYAGNSAAIIASIPVDPSFSFEIGMQYSLLCGFQKNTDDSQINNTPFVINNEENRVNLDYVSSVQPLGTNKELPIAKLHYIDLPVSLTYRPIAPLRIHMGLKASYLVYANADWQDPTGNVVTDPSSFEYRSDRDDALYESMKKFDFGTVLGFGYYPANNFGLDIRYNHGLIDNTIDESWQTRQITTNKSFELTLTYFLSK